MGFGGTTSHAEFSEAERYSGAARRFTMTITERRPGTIGRTFARSTTCPVSFLLVDEKEPPVRATDLGVPRIETSTSAMKLPDGWGAELPEAVHAHSRYANLDETYRFENGTLYAERKVEVLVK